jgi:hypothetical protein
MIDQSGLSDSANATIKICAFNSKVRTFHSLRAIACLKNSRRSSWVGKSDVIADCSSLAHLICVRSWGTASNVDTVATSLDAPITMMGTEDPKERFPGIAPAFQ